MVEESEERLSISDSFLFSEAQQDERVKSNFLH